MPLLSHFPIKNQTLNAPPCKLTSCLPNSPVRFDDFPLVRSPLDAKNFVIVALFRLLLKLLYFLQALLRTLKCLVDLHCLVRRGHFGFRWNTKNERKDARSYLGIIGLSFIQHIQANVCLCPIAQYPWLLMTADCGRAKFQCLLMFV